MIQEIIPTPKKVEVKEGVTIVPLNIISLEKDWQDLCVAFSDCFNKIYNLVCKNLVSFSIEMKTVNGIFLKILRIKGIDSEFSIQIENMNVEQFCGFDNHVGIVNKRFSRNSSRCVS